MVVLIDLKLPAGLWPRIRLSLLQKLLPGLSLGVGGVKEAGAYGWQPYHLYVPIV